MTAKYGSDEERNAARRLSGKINGPKAHGGRPPSQKRLGRAYDRISDIATEDYWFEIARRLGVVDDTMTRDQQRRTVKRFADSQTLEYAVTAEPGTPPPVDDNDAAQEKWRRFESARLRRAAEIDRQHAAEHDRQAGEHEAALADLLFDREFPR